MRTRPLVAGLAFALLAIVIGFYLGEHVSRPRSTALAISDDDFHQMIKGLVAISRYAPKPLDSSNGKVPNYPVLLLRTGDDISLFTFNNAPKGYAPISEPGYTACAIAIDYLWQGANTDMGSSDFREQLNVLEWPGTAEFLKSRGISFENVDQGKQILTQLGIYGKTHAETFTHAIVVSGDNYNSLMSLWKDCTLTADNSTL